MPDPLTLEDLLSLRDNRDQFRRLKERIEGAMGVVPFVGAGLSMPCGMPGWGSFLKDEGKLAACEAEIAACLSRSEFEEAAELLSTALGPLAFRDRIDGRFGKHAGRAPRSAVLHLPRLTRGPVVTTNFDRVIERVFEEAGAPFEERVFGPRPDLFAAALHENERYLLKVHGDYKERTDRVLTLAEYEAHYGSKSAGGVDLTRPLPKVLEQVFTSRTLLFLGCSLGPDRTLLLLKRVADLHGAPPPHFAIVATVADGQMPARIRFLSEHHVRPLWYPEGRHEAVETFLQALLGGGVPPTVGAEPHDPAERLADAERRRVGLASEGGDTSEIDREVLSLRRSVREGQPLRSGEAFESYRLVKRIGHGGFATVWEAMDARHAHVAIKVLHPHVAEDPQRRARFFRGARITASLAGAGVVKILEVGPEDAPRGYFVMELLSTDLYRTVLAGTLTRPKIFGHIVRVGRALHAIHENTHRYVHRDIKPQNILLGACGEAWLSDFDLAGAADTTGGTRTGGLGTFVYSAPECLNDAQAADRRADVFSLGMTAIFCFAGKDLPLDVVRSTGAFLATISCPLALRVVLEKATAWKAADRYQTAGELCDALEAADKASRSLVRTYVWQIRHTRPFDVRLPIWPHPTFDIAVNLRELRNMALAMVGGLAVLGVLASIGHPPLLQRVQEEMGRVARTVAAQLAPAASSSSPAVAPPKLDGLAVAIPFPPRPADAPTGRQFFEQNKSLGHEQLLNAIRDEILGGNVPATCRHLHEVTVVKNLKDQQKHVFKMAVAGDYLAIGSDEDFVRVPMLASAAQRIADRFGCKLPTKLMVDEIYQGARGSLILAPSPVVKPLHPESWVWMLLQQTGQLRDQTRNHKMDGSLLIAGHKKDIVVSQRIESSPHQLILYGWHDEQGKPLQPLSTAPTDTSIDYSVGVRLVSDEVLVDGQKMLLTDVLKDENLSVFISDEGPFRHVSYAL